MITQKVYRDNNYNITEVITYDDNIQIAIEKYNTKGELIYIKNKDEETYYKDKKKHGKCIEYYDNGIIQSIHTYNNGFEIGEITRYHPNGILALKGIVNDNYFLHDNFIQWNNNGQILRHSIYENGDLILQKDYEENILISEKFHTPKVDDGKVIYQKSIWDYLDILRNR